MIILHGYTEGDKLGIVVLITETDEDNGLKSGEYDTYNGNQVLNGLRYHFHEQYGEIEDVDENIMTVTGLDKGLIPCLVCYVKSRLFEDLGDMQKAMYYRQMFKKMYSQYPLRKSGVRQLGVPRI